MKHGVGTMTALILAVVPLTLARPVAGEEDVRAAVDAAYSKFMGAVKSGDGAALAALYTVDGQLLPAQSDAVTGTDAIRAFWQGVFDSGTKGATLTTLELESHGDVAYEVGRYELRGADDVVLDSGKYVVIWKREDGAWKLHRDIWTTSASPPQE